MFSAYEGPGEEAKYMEDIRNTTAEWYEPLSYINFRASLYPSNLRMTQVPTPVSLRCLDTPAVMCKQNL